jgi:hypothetical protein
MRVTFQQVFAILFETFEIFLILSVLLAYFPQIFLQLLSNAFFLLLFLLSTELGLAFLQLFLLSQSYSQFFRLVLHSLDQIFITVFGN